MSKDEFFAVDTAEQPWEERHNPRLGRAILRKDLYTDPETGGDSVGALPGGARQPRPHPPLRPRPVCPGRRPGDAPGDVRPGDIPPVPEGRGHGARAGPEAGVTVLFVANKSFRIDYV